MTVTFECGSANALLGIDEPEKCTYAARVTSPAACEGKHAEALRLELEGGDEDSLPGDAASGDDHDHGKAAEL